MERGKKVMEKDEKKGRKNKRSEGGIEKGKEVMEKDEREGKRERKRVWSQELRSPGGLR